MEPGTMPPAEQAKSIFDDLGYTVEGNGPEFRAQRKWRVVRVTATAEADHPDHPDQPSATGDEPYQCFVTWSDDSSELCERLQRSDPEYEWAVIGVTDDGYEVVEADSAR